MLNNVFKNKYLKGGVLCFMVLLGAKSVSANPQTWREIGKENKELLFRDFHDDTNAKIIAQEDAKKEARNKVLREDLKRLKDSKKNLTGIELDRVNFQIQDAEGYLKRYEENKAKEEKENALYLEATKKEAAKQLADEKKIINTLNAYEKKGCVFLDFNDKYESQHEKEFFVFNCKKKNVVYDLKKGKECKRTTTKELARMKIPHTIRYDTYNFDEDYTIRIPFLCQRNAENYIIYISDIDADAKLVEIGDNGGINDNIFIESHLKGAKYKVEGHVSRNNCVGDRKYLCYPDWSETKNFNHKVKYYTSMSEALKDYKVWQERIKKFEKELEEGKIGTY